MLMGIVNVNDDSFSGDGTLDIAEALRRAASQAEAGADVIDVGAESARTNRSAIAVAEEIARLRDFLVRWPQTVAELKPADTAQVWPPVLSVNTWRPEVIAGVLPLGVELVNDMGGLPEARNARICAEYGAALLLMHTVGVPKIAQTDRQWPDIMAELRRFFQAKLALASSAGMGEEQLILDPGIDFAKQRDDNLRLLNELGILHEFGRPLLLPISRKTVIGDVLGIEDPIERDAGTMALLATGVSRGAHLFRVHHVAAAWQALKVLWAVERAGE